MTRSVKHIAIWPSPWNYHLQNRIFQDGFGPGGAYVKAFALWRDMALAADCQIDTWDLVEPGKADVLWFIDLPRRRSILEDAKRAHPNARTVLMVCESPLFCPQMFNARNRELFDHVVSYETESFAGGFHSYRLPVPEVKPLEGPSFDRRRLLCMVNSNRVQGFSAMRQQGWEGLPGIGMFFNGWYSNIDDIRRIMKPDLYVERRKIARSSESRPELSIDFFGKGWNGEQISWNPLYKNRPYKCHKGNFVADRLATLSQYRFSLAYENWRGSYGYITDRIFDGFLAGTVPVYLGDDHIQDCVPCEAFVDARGFASHDDLFSYLECMPESEWDEMRKNGRNFLASELGQTFSEESFAQKMLSVLKAAVS